MVSERTESVVGDLDSISPVEAMMLLYELKKLAKSAPIRENKSEFKRTG